MRTTSWGLTPSTAWTSEDLRSTQRHGARLVEHHDIDVAEAFQISAAFDDHALLGCPADCAENR